MGLDRRTFLTSLSLAPAATLVGAAACQPVAHEAPVMPLMKALRDAKLDDTVEPALHFVPLRRRP